MPADRYAVGIDLGGSKAARRPPSESGQLVAARGDLTEAWKGTSSVLASLKRIVAELLDSTDRSRVTGIGIAAAGQIHPQTHAVVYAPNLKWTNVPLRDEIESHFGSGHLRRERRAGRRVGRVSLRGGAAGCAASSRCSWAPAWDPARWWMASCCAASTTPPASWATRRSWSTASPVPAGSVGAWRLMPPGADSSGGSRPRSMRRPHRPGPGDGGRRVTAHRRARGARSCRRRSVCRLSLGRRPALSRRRAGQLRHARSTPSCWSWAAA